MIIFLSILCAVLCVLCGYLLAKKRKTEREIRELSSYLLAVQDRNALPAVNDALEGELRILQSEIYKVAGMLETQYANEQEKNRFLKDMIEDVSHQIKTPLTALTIMNDRLLQKNLSEEERRKCLQAIRMETRHIDALVHDLLTSAQIDAGVLPVRFEERPLCDCVNHVKEHLEILAELKGIEIHTDVPEQIVISYDHKWLSEALSNMVKNSIEHTGEGGMISIHASGSALYTDLLIEDNGEGIKEEDLPHIFERFHKAGSTPGSTGIGLHLAYQIITLHHGRIQVSGSEGKGTCFAIRFWHNG